MVRFAVVGALVLFAAADALAVTDWRRETRATKGSRGRPRRIDRAHCRTRRAPYLMTDLGHLNGPQDGLWGHVLQYGFAAWTGNLLGVVIGRFQRWNSWDPRNASRGDRDIDPRLGHGHQSRTFARRASRSPWQSPT